MAAAHLEKVEKDTMGKKKLVNEFFWISYVLFFGMYLTKYQNLRLGFQAYFKHISWKSCPPLKSKKMPFCLICSMDISNVIYLLFFKFIDTILFYSTLKSNFIGFHQSQLQAILPK
jgi:hypothetical protein